MRIPVGSRNADWWTCRVSELLYQLGTAIRQNTAATTYTYISYLFLLLLFACPPGSKSPSKQPRLRNKFEEDKEANEVKRHASAPYGSHFRVERHPHSSSDTKDF